MTRTAQRTEITESIKLTTRRKRYNVMYFLGGCHFVFKQTVLTQRMHFIIFLTNGLPSFPFIYLYRSLISSITVIFTGFTLSVFFTVLSVTKVSEVVIIKRMNAIVFSLLWLITMICNQTF